MTGRRRSRTAARRLPQQIETQLDQLPDSDAITTVRREHGQLTRQLTDLADQSVGPHEQTPPRHLTAVLGGPPADAHDRHRWRDAARTIELYRLRWDITDPTRPTPPGPSAQP
ncbi:MAG: hypothetical protein KY461_14390 [Actinobacteria bacterium]|nr:hypothetical protein [Actinomycetota bacterium]